MSVNKQTKTDQNFAGRHILRKCALWALSARTTQMAYMSSTIILLKLESSFIVSKYKTYDKAKPVRYFRSSKNMNSFRLAYNILKL